MSWTNGRPLGALFYGKSGAGSFAKMFDHAKRRALIRRRHRVWTRQQDAQTDETGPVDESTGGSLFDVLFE